MIKIFFAKESGEHSIINYNKNLINKTDEYLQISPTHTLLYNTKGKLNKFFSQFAYNVYGDVIVIKCDEEKEVDIENNFPDLVALILERDINQRKKFIASFSEQK
jgi:hypothetical protein